MLTIDASAIGYVIPEGDYPMASTINGVSTKPMPGSVTKAMNRGVPKRQALSTGPKPVSTVKVK